MALPNDTDPLRREVARLQARVQALESALQQSELQRAALLDGVSCMVLIHDDEGRLLATNATAAEQLGYPPDVAATLTLQQLETGEPSMHLPERIARLESLGSLTFNTTLRRHDNQSLAVEVEARRVPWNGRPAIANTCRPAAHRPLAEDALRTSEARLRRAQAAARMGNWTWHVGADQLEWSDEMFRIFGVDRATFTGKVADILPRSVHPDDREAVERANLSVTRGGKPVAAEYRVIWPDGSVHHIHAEAGEQILDQHGDLVTLSGYAQDITEQKRTEKALQRSQERYQSFVSQSREAIYCLEFDQPVDAALPVEAQLDAIYENAYIGECNQAMASMYGLTSVQDLLGRRLVDLHAGSDNLKNRDTIRAFIENGHHSADRETEEVTPTGEKRNFLNNDVGIVEHGRLLRIWGTALDITERKRAEDEKQKLQAQLRQAQKMESVGRLAGGVAHDFNNMLSVILGQADLAAEEVGDQPRLLDHLIEIRRAAERSAGITRQLLAFARKQPIAPRVIDLNESIGPTLNMLRRLIGENIALHWHPGHVPWPVRVDPSQVDQLLTNLCVNSRDAIGGGGTITIATSPATLDEEWCSIHTGAQSGEYVLLAITDSGCGMAKDTLEHVFEPFFTTKELGRGTGLGLATVYGIVKQNHGFVAVVSEPGKGTTFEIYLPRHDGPIEPAACGSSARPTEHGRETVLLVEDEPAILVMLARMLEAKGYCVLSAQSPNEALRLSREHAGEIHLILTDVVMPEMNGRSLADAVLPRHPRAKVLFMSGYSGDVIANHGVLDEAVNFIAKPFSPKEMTEKVRAVLGRDD